MRKNRKAKVVGRIICWERGSSQPSALRNVTRQPSSTMRIKSRQNLQTIQVTWKGLEVTELLKHALVG